MQFHLIEIIDGANFSRTIINKGFIDLNKAEAWATKKVTEYQEKRREEGETDEAFIEAIYSKRTSWEVDESEEYDSF